MHTELTSSEIALRLLLSFAAGAILGANRGQQGRAAGLRTTVLVCLTASSSMILANLLLRTTGRAPDSFVSMDVMRLPLGILTGMGFIGAGAILHRENMILGVTTAATLWFTTLMGFCFGSGELGLALSLLGLGVFVLWCLEWVEAYWTQRLEAVLVVIVTPDGPSHEEIAQALQGQHYNLSAPAVKYTREGRELRYEVHWRASPRDTAMPRPITELAERPGVKELHWSPPLVKG